MCQYKYIHENLEEKVSRTKKTKNNNVHDTQYFIKIEINRKRLIIYSPGGENKNRERMKQHPSLKCAVMRKMSFR